MPSSHFVSLRVQVDFISVVIHVCTLEGLEAYLHQLRRYGKPIWVTELSCPRGKRNESLSKAEVRKVQLCAICGLGR